MIDLERLGRCFLGASPAMLATSAADGTPNVAFISQVFLVDARHVALSCQFFNKTRRNLAENPRASILLLDPLTLEGYRLLLRFERSESRGPLFDAMALRIQAIASQTGMTGIFGLVSADVFEVERVEAVSGFIEGGASGSAEKTPAGSMTDLVRLRTLSERVNQAASLDDLLHSTLSALDELFGFSHSMVLVPDDGGRRLVAIASHGYETSGAGAEVAIGDGLIGTVAQRRRLLRISAAGSFRYARAVRAGIETTSGGGSLPPEVPLPGLPDPQSQMAAPLTIRDRLLGVLAVESRNPFCFEAWHETFLQIIANQIAIGIDRFGADDEGDGERRAPAPDQPAGTSRRFTYYRNDDCIFVDGEYLVRNVPAKILRKLLVAHRDEGRTEFSNRELRLDDGLGLPDVRDNLESRLILLRRRLEEKCPDVALVPVRRGRFALALRCAVQLDEKEGA